jgi:lipoate-protein ligase A
VSLPTFGFVAIHQAPLADGVASEAEWCAQVATTGRPTARLWRQAQALVVPSSYERRARWHEACADSAAAGWPVQVRSSGGGLVPQGPGVWNLSLVWAAESVVPTDTAAIYRALTDELRAALARLGIESNAQAVQGSLCDGRFNLAVGGRKLVGTAQAWRRIEGRPVVLAHAVTLVTADPAALTAVANRFEAESGGNMRYEAGALTSVAQVWNALHGAYAPAPDLEAQWLHAVAERFARVLPPREQPSGEALQ